MMMGVAMQGVPKRAAAQNRIIALEFLKTIF